MLCQDGFVRFADIETCRDLFQIGQETDPIVHYHLSSNGKFCACTLHSGQLHIYDLPSTWKELNRPPSPMVRVLRSNDDTTSQITSSRGSTTARSSRSKVTSATMSTSNVLAVKKRSQSASDRSRLKQHYNTRIADKTSISSVSTLDQSAVR